MCSNYRPVTSADRLAQYFGVVHAHDAPPVDTYPSGLGPCILLARPGDNGAHHGLALVGAIFRLVPDFVAKLTWARHTYNARSETVATKPTYRGPWRRGQRCIIPADWIYEPNHENGRYERWRIQRADGAPLGVAGIFETYEHNGQTWYGMSMLTVNADEHPFMKRFHEPDEEKRMVVILNPEDYGPWLTGTVAEATQMLRPWHGELEGFHEPVPGRAPRATSGRVVRALSAPAAVPAPPAPPPSPGWGGETGQLF